jgi:hypothetical protein
VLQELVSLTNMSKKFCDFKSADECLYGRDWVMSSDPTICPTLLGKAILENKQLRELNAELLAALKRLNSEYGRQDEDALEQAELVIAKAERLK